MDVLLSASHDFIMAEIPSKIKKISPYAFSGSRKLKMVKFSEDSELLSICKYAFFDSAIEKIQIPAKTKELGEHSFSNCFNFKMVEFSQKAELKIMDSEEFSNSTLRSIAISRSVASIGKRAFANSARLNAAEFFCDDLTLDLAWFDSCPNMNVVSFPSSSQIEILPNDIDIVSTNLSVFVCPKTIVKICSREIY